jgi:hypothetical protein
MAKLVNIYPKGPSIGSAMPTALVRTSGRRQYPRTLALRGNVSVLERWAEPGFEVGGCEGWWGEESEGEIGGDIRERIRWRMVEPKRARP